MTVQITFQPPSRDDSTSSPPIHKRKLEGVPRPVAKEITEDLRTYQSNPSSTNPWKLYRYQKIGEEAQGEVITPIDFREVLDVAIA